MHKEIVRTQIRFPVGIMESLKRWAKDDGRSLNSFCWKWQKRRKRGEKIMQVRNKKALDGQTPKASVKKHPTQIGMNLCQILQ